MKQEMHRLVLSPASRRAPPGIFLSLSLSHSRVCICALFPPVLPLDTVFFLSIHAAAILAPAPAPSLSLPDDSDPARHKRVINYLRVGHVFPSCSLSPPSVRFHPPLVPFLPLPSPDCVSPAAFHLAPPTLGVCTHSLMLIRLNAQKPSRGRGRERALPRLAEKLRAITKRESPPTIGVVTDDLVENNRDVRPLVRYVTGEKIP